MTAETSSINLDHLSEIDTHSQLSTADDSGSVYALSSTMDEYGSGGEYDDIEITEYDMSKLPPHACQYCGIHSPQSVVQCVETGKWFCNSSSGLSGSHIINHLVRSRHKKVAFHPDSEIGDSTIECFNCGCRNPFLLGLIPAEQDSVFIFLCREPCLNIASIKDMSWDVDEWKPLVEERSFLSWLVSVPSEEELLRARSIDTASVIKLEELWKSNPDATLDDLDKQEAWKDDIESVAIRYDDANHYRRVYDKLVYLEAEEERKRKESQTQHGVTVRWDVGMSSDLRCIFTLSRANESSVRVVTGDELLLTYPYETRKGPWKAKGYVVSINSSEEIVLALESKRGAPVDQTTGFNVDFVWKSTSFDRSMFAMKRFLVDQVSVSGYLFHTLLGHEVDQMSIDTKIPNILSAPNLPQLNPSQEKAVKSVLRRPLSLIQGPPGTGKTVTSATIVYHLSQSCSNGEQVLVCAPSNIAVDHLTYKIHQTGLRVVRIAARGREHLTSNVDFLSLHVLVKELAHSQRSALDKYFLLLDKQGELSKSDRNAFNTLLRKTELQILKSADVICCTNVGSGSPRLREFRFKHVLIDEATQATEPETLIPLVRGSKQVVLVGDHCQLGPVIMCKEAQKAGLNLSMFERLILLGIKPIRLNIQYRMHPCLSEFPSDTFYDGSLQNGVTMNDRIDTRIDFPWPNRQTPMIFYATSGKEEISGSGTSYLNRVETATVEKVITKLLSGGCSPSQVGVITPYEGQRAYITSYLMRNGTLNKSLYEQIEVASVDSFQGREKDYIVISCVRSNDHQGIGFLSDSRRLNVAITRARYGLVVIGNPKVLFQNTLWNNLLCHFQKRNLMFEGPLMDLKKYLISLDAPRKYHHHPFGRFSFLNDAPKREEEEEEEMETYAHPGSIDFDQLKPLDALSSQHLAMGMMNPYSHVFQGSADSPFSLKGLSLQDDSRSGK